MRIRARILLDSVFMELELSDMGDGKDPAREVFGPVESAKNDYWDMVDLWVVHAFRHAGFMIVNNTAKGVLDVSW